MRRANRRRRFQHVLTRATRAGLEPLEPRTLLTAFSFATTYATSAWPIDVAAGDLNGDGIDDVVSANINGSSVSVLLNKKTYDGSLNARVDYPTAGSPESIALADFNGDNKLDIIVAGSALSLLINNGDGTFAAKVDTALPSGSAQVTVADFNGDTKMDLAVAQGQNASIFLGNGNGTFQARVDYFVSAFPTDIVAADFNNDNKPDLAVTTDLGTNVHVLLNSGTGTFGAKVSYPVGNNPLSVKAADFDGDGFNDLAVTSGDVGVSVLHNNGNGTFAAKVDYSTDANTQGLAIADFNGDGKKDLAVTDSYSSGAAGILLNNGNGTFAAAVHYQVGANPNAIAVGDFNLDGRPDFAVSCSGIPGVVVALNGNAGTFADVARYTKSDGGVNINGPRIAVAADFNGDNKKDIAFIQDNNFLAVTLNNGDGTFPPFTNYPSGGAPRGLVAGDFNKDGKIDLALCNSGDDTISIYINNGNGTFAAKKDFVTGDNPISLTTADFNGDGKLDIVTLNHGSSTFSLMLGDGAGNFAVSANYAVGGFNGYITSGDVTGDGLADVLVAGGAGVQVFPNSLSTFFVHNDYTTGAFPISIIITDVNNDSRPDILATSEFGENITMLTNSGGGVFVNTDLDIGSSGGHAFVTAADFDKDGKIDVATAESDGSVKIVYGHGNGTFDGLQSFTTGLGNGFVTAADLNNDSRSDLVFLAWQGASLFTFLNFDMTPHPPVTSDTTLTTLQEVTLPITQEDFLDGYTSPDGADLVSVKITTLPAHGVLKVGGVDVTLNQVITDFSDIEYEPDFNFFGSDSFKWTANDGRFDSAAAATTKITVTRVNHAPTDLALSNATIVENKAKGTVVGALSTTDRDTGNTFSYKLVAGAGDDDNAAFTIAGGSLKLAAPLNFENQETYSVRIRTTDQGALTFEKVFVITATDIEEAPTLTPFSLTTPQNNTLAIAGADFLAAFSDQDTGGTPHDLEKVKITALPKKGTLKLDGTPVTLNQEIDEADLDDLSYTPKTDFLGSDTIGWAASDGTLYSVLKSTLTVHVVGPEITVLGGKLTILDGDITPSATDGTDFGSILQGGVPIAQTFTIKNVGTSDLTLGAVTVPAGFTVASAPSSPIAPGQSTTLVIEIDPASLGTFAGTVSFTNNDTGVGGVVESPFEFNITATVIAFDAGAKNTIKIVATKPKASEVKAATTGKGTFTLTRSGPTLNFAQAVEYQITGSADDGTDFIHLTGVATFAPKKPTTTITLQPILDALAEGLEDVTITIIGDTNATYAINNSLSSATATIADGASTITVTANKPTAKELGGSAAAGAGQFTFKRVGGSTENPLTVHYTITGTAANDGSDFPALSGIAIIPAGKTSVVVTVNPVDDFEIEGNETVIATIDADGAYFLAAPNKSATITITDHNRKLTTTAITPLAGTVDTPLTISFDDLKTAVGVIDPESETITFKIKAVTKGTLTKNAVAVVKNITTLVSGESFVWTPPAGLSGTITAFSITASDGVNVTKPLVIKVLI